MIKKIILLSLFLLLIVNTSFGQKLKRYDDLLLFKEVKSKQPIIIINDSLLYKGKQLIPFKHSEYPDKISEYIPFEIGTKTYLVHQACGPVLEFRNDSIVRIDNSFLHKNQFYPVPFTYNNEIYLFGGYGLFTYKNIITRYDFKSGEWNQVQTKGKKIPEPRASAYSLLNGNTLYVFGGKTNDGDNIPKFKAVQPELWKLDLPTMTWSYVSLYNPNLLTTFDNRIQYKYKLYLLEGFITEINFTQKTANKYSFKNYEELRKHFIIEDTIYGIFSSSDNKLYFKKTSIADLKGKFIGSVPFFIEANTTAINYPTMGLIGVTLLSLVFIGYKKRNKFFQKSFIGIVYESQKDQFFYKKKLITHFEENEKKLLFFLLGTLDQFVSLNQLNSLFENPVQPQTTSAIIKRREQAINGLINKVSKLTGIPENQLQLEQKNMEDKRLKDLLLLPKLLKKL
mgnify:CR=1 FL=1